MATAAELDRPADALDAFPPGSARLARGEFPAER